MGHLVLFHNAYFCKMLIATRAIVLKSIKFQDSSLIVKMFTETHGVQSFMIKGVRSVKANGKAGLFQSGMILDLIMYYQENKSLKTLKEYKAAYIYESALYDIRKSSVLLFLFEILEQIIHDDSVDEHLFQFLVSALQQFDAQPFQPDFHLHFLLDFMKHLGMYPNGFQTESLPFFNIKEGEFVMQSSNNPFVLNKDDSSLMNLLLLRQTPFSKQERKRLLQIILDYFHYHIEHFRGVKSLAVLEAIML
jgi:DNA repair protein RecO (recombination protein O)